MSDGRAQTNLDLFRQLRDDGWSESDLHRIVAAHELAARLFSGCVRVTGKSFIAHVIGTASIAAAHGERPEAVLAALLHAAYDRGDFGGVSRGITDDKRKRLRESTDDGVEQLVAAYSSTRWDQDAITAMCDQTNLDDQQRDVVALRLANDLEELLDREHRYHRRGETELARHHLAATLGSRHGMIDLAQRIESILAIDSAENTEFGVGEFERPGRSLFLPPASYRPRLHVRLTRAWRALHRRIPQRFR